MCIVAWNYSYYAKRLTSMGVLHAQSTFVIINHACDNRLCPTGGAKTDGAVDTIRQTFRY
jgi:hypothetical protein